MTQRKYFLSGLTIKRFDRVIYNLFSSGYSLAQVAHSVSCGAHFKVVRAPRLAPWASKRLKREVRKYAVEALVDKERDGAGTGLSADA